MRKRERGRASAGWGFCLLGLVLAGVVALGGGAQAAAGHTSSAPHLRYGPPGRQPTGLFSEIYAMNADGSERVDLTHDPFWDADPSWSPDGTKIAYTYRINDIEIYVMNANGSGQTDLTNDPSALDIDPTWSPDGTKIAWARAGSSDYAMFPTSVWFAGPP
jgi:hypothetical protein